MNSTLLQSNPWLQWQAHLASDLQQVQAIYDQALASSVPFIQDLVDHLSYYRGKQLRPVLLLLTAQACGGIYEAHHQLAAVMEMIHTATLVHDDILDEATIRRHHATIHSRWDNTCSVLLGDLLFTRSFHLASQTGSAQACEWIGEATNRVCEGELLQISHRGNWHLSEAEYIAIIRGKTAELTACCCRLGAAFSQTNEQITNYMWKFGLNLGIAFQIVDDLLDLLGDEDEVGKSLGTDLVQQKMTLPLIYMMNQLPIGKQVEIKTTLQEQNIDDSPGFSALLEESGAIAYAREKAKTYANKARECLTCIPASKSRQYLAELTEQVLNRNR